MFFVQSCAVCNAETESGVFCPACRHNELLLEAMPGLLNLDGAVMGYKSAARLKKCCINLNLKVKVNFCSRWRKKLYFSTRRNGESCFDIVVSVPTDAARRRQRGFDIPEVFLPKRLPLKACGSRRF